MRAVENGWTTRLLGNGSANSPTAARLGGVPEVDSVRVGREQLAPELPSNFSSDGAGLGPGCKKLATSQSRPIGVGQHASQSELDPFSNRVTGDRHLTVSLDSLE
jgi:hypothetical protein